MKGTSLFETIPALRRDLVDLQARYTVAPSISHHRAGLIGRGWFQHYAVCNLAVTLPAGATSVPRELFLRSVDLFRLAHSELALEKTFLLLELSPSASASEYCVVVFLDIDVAFDAALESVFECVDQLFRLSQTNSNFITHCGVERTALVTYSKTNRRVLALSFKNPPDFSQHYLASSYQPIFDDTYSDMFLAQSGMFTGNACYFDGRYQEAIENWKFSIANKSHPDALFNIACVLSKLGQMEAAYEYCQKAVDEGVNRDLLLRDGDLEEFRRHPLYQRILENLER